MPITRKERGIAVCIGVWIGISFLLGSLGSKFNSFALSTFAFGAFTAGVVVLIVFAYSVQHRADQERARIKKEIEQEEED